MHLGLFQVLELSAVQFWEHLVWMDTANHGGVREIMLTQGPRRRGGQGEDYVPVGSCLFRPYPYVIFFFLFGATSAIIR